jgi:hypothetical protein
MKATINLLAGKLNPAIIEHIPSPSHQSPLIDARDIVIHTTQFLWCKRILPYQVEPWWNENKVCW